LKLKLVQDEEPTTLLPFSYVSKRRKKTDKYKDLKVNECYSPHSHYKHCDLKERECLGIPTWVGCTINKHATHWPGSHRRVYCHTAKLGPIGG
jgi:hypothetical protein